LGDRISDGKTGSQAGRLDAKELYQAGKTAGGVIPDVKIDNPLSVGDLGPDAAISGLNLPFGNVRIVCRDGLPERRFLIAIYGISDRLDFFRIRPEPDLCPPMSRVTWTPSPFRLASGMG